MLPIPMISKVRKSAESIYFGFFSPSNSVIKVDEDANILYSLSPRNDSNSTRNNIQVDNIDDLYLLFDDTGSNQKINKYDDTNLLSSFTVTDGGVGPINTTYISLDNNNNYYVAGRKISSNNTIFKKYTVTNTLLFNIEITHSTATNQRKIINDKLGNVYITGDLSDNITTRKFNSSGTLLWSVSHGAATNSIAVDLNNNVYIAGSVTGFISTRKYDELGTLLWSVNDGQTVNDICVDANGNLYTGFSTNNNLNTRKYDTNGNIIWEKDSGASVRAISVDKVGNVYISNLTTPRSVKKYNSSGDLIWSVDVSSLIATATPDLRSIDTFPPNRGAFLS